MTEIPEWMKTEIAEYAIEMVPAPQTVLDIGANVGAYAIECARRWPEAQIRCYEPVAANFNGLIINTKGIKKIHHYRFAVRSFNGRDKILIGDHGVTCGFYQLGRQTDETEQVLCVDAGELPSAELVKIDTEGCEVEILSRLNLSKTRALVVEYHRPEDISAIQEAAAKAGLQTISVLHKNGHGILKYGRPEAGIQFRVEALKGSSVEMEGQDRNGRERTQGAQKETEIKWAEKLKDRALFIGVCSHFSNNDFAFVQSLLEFHNLSCVKWTIQWSCEPSVERSRNVLAANFLAAKEFTHLLYIDSDIAFVPHCVHSVCSHDADIVGGTYPLKNQNPVTQWCGNSMESLGLTQSPPDENGLQEVGCIGTGFLCIARSALEKIIAADGPQVEYLQDWPPYRKEYAFFRQEVREVGGKRRFLTEDWNFCFRWRELGGKVYADTRVILKHAGRAVWPLDLQRGNPFVSPQRDGGESPRENAKTAKDILTAN